MKTFAFISSALLLAGTLMAGSMTGWISDAACSSGNAGAEAAKRDCAKRCIEGGEAPVFVDDKDSKVYKLVNAPSAKALLERKVVVSGNVKGDTIEVTSIDYVKK